MSDLSASRAAADPKQKDQERLASALKKYGKQPEGTSALWADSDLVNRLYEETTTMAGEKYVDNMLFPRYGLLTLILRTTPVYLYNHPAMKAKCRTAFTDGVHLFICEEFYRTLIKDVEDSHYVESGTEPLILHELMHKMLDHVTRLRQFDAKLANRAADLSINTKLQAAFPELTWVTALRETGVGFAPGDIEKYLPMSEESIARELLTQDLKNKQNGGGNGKDGQGKPDPNQKGQKGQKGQGQPGQGSPGEGEGEGEPGEGDQPSDSFGDADDNHMVPLKDLIETLEEAGLDDAKAALNLPDSDNVEEIGRVMNDTQDRQHESMLQAMAQSAQSNGKYPGQHIVESATEYMKGFGKGKLSWRLAVRELILGEGMKFRGSFEAFADLAYVDDIEEDLGTPLYLPAEIPHKADETVFVLFDTSGSVSTDDLRAFITECLELKTAAENMGDSASEVIIMSADTVMRGDPVVITDDNADEMMEQGMAVFGRGGTDLGHSLKTALELPILKEKKIRTILYFTDLFDTPPKRESLGLQDDMQIVYVAAPSTASSHVEEFKRAVESYADVVMIKEGVEVDLTGEVAPQVQPQKARARA